MNLAFLQLPMVLFTTLAPMASGAFIGLAIAFLTTRFSSERLGRIDRWTLLPLGIFAAGFVAALWPSLVSQGMSGALRDFGVGGLAMEPAVSLAGLAFASLAVVYWIIALTGNLDYRARSVFATAVGAGALVLSFAIGMPFAGSAALSWGSLLAAIGLMGLTVIGLPLATPETIGWLGYRLARRLARALGVLLVLVGFWICL